MGQIEAVYRDGAFQPLVPIHLHENQRVRLTVQPVEATDAEAWLADVRRRQQRMIEQRGFLPDSTPEIAADRLR
jgi:predicted DNA-binding antitoxin AbrB/MazE fold protein